MKILLVEDDKATVEAIRLSVEIYLPKSEVVSVDQGRPAIEELKTGGFDVLVIDLGLPDMDGLDVLDEIRWFSKVPTIIISARNNIEAMIRAKDMGVAYYITKPFDYHLLIRRIEEIAGHAMT